MKIICIGRNYVDHAKELGNKVPDKPMFFLKPDTALLRQNNPFYYPEFSKEIHYETEVVVKINKVGKYIYFDSEKFGDSSYPSNFVLYLRKYLRNSIVQKLPVQ